MSIDFKFARGRSPSVRILPNHMLPKYSLPLLALVLSPLLTTGQDQPSPTVIAVDAAHPGASISPQMFGIFFEDINFGADGGLYPERSRTAPSNSTNRSPDGTRPSDDSQRRAGRTKGELDIRTEDALNATNPHYLRVRAYEPGFGLWNSGFRGIGIESGAEYRFSAYVRTAGPKAVRATITDESGREIGTGTLAGFNREWKRYETVIRTNATAQRAHFNLFLDEKGDVDLDMISLFPVDTWKSRPNGLRKDLVQLLQTCTPDSSVSPEDASWKAGGW